MAKVTPVDRTTRAQVVVKTKANGNKAAQGYSWWKAATREELNNQVIDTVSFLKEQQQYRFRQASMYARMYGNMPLANVAGSVTSKLSTNQALPMDRPTMNVVQSCVDTLVSRIAQSKPRPLFLTENAEYKQRNLAKQLNQFIGGELYQTKAYELASTILRDAAILGSGVLHVFETQDCRVGLERVLLTELLVDANDSFYGAPRSMYRLKLVDRTVLSEIFPKYRSKVESAEQAYPDNSGDSQKTMSDQVMIAEAWHLPSSEEAKDGRHVICCTSGTLLDEEYTKDSFPFVFMHYAPRLVGLWAQGLSEQLAGTQIEINKLLITISQSINLVGVPRVFVEDGSKIVKAHLNNQIGAIVTYRGTKPEYEVAPCVPAEMYAQLQRLIEYAYQQSGISALAASSQKPAGLNSGEAIRSYDDLQTDRFATLEKRYHEIFIDLSYKIIDKARDIALRDGSYQTVYPNKDGTKEIDLPAAKLLDDPFIIQCFDSSSLPKDPAGRLQTITEYMQSGIIDPQEGRRLLDLPDLDQWQKLANAAEERILKTLDEIVDTGKYTPPDPFTDIELGIKLVTQYYNLYVAANLEESKAEKLRTYKAQLMALKQAAMPPPMAVPMAAPQAVPQQRPVSDTLPNIPQ